MASNPNSIQVRDNNTIRDVKQTVIHNIENIQIGNTAETEEIQDFKDDYHSNLKGEEIKEILKDINGNLKLPTAPWLETGDQLLIQEYFIQLELKDERKTISLENIFTTEISQEKLKRIYIEAPPGFGKTTLAHKLASDWVRAKEYIQHFNLAFLVILRYLKGKSVKTMLAEIVKHKEKEKLWELINNRNTLLIFDGLDEIGDEDRLKVINLQFKGTIIITGRTGSYRLDPNKKLKYSSGIEKSNKFWMRHITICGIEKENRFVFLGRFFDQNGNWEIIRDRIDELTNSLDKLFQSSLMLILLAYVLTENPDLNIRNKTDLYKNLINCLVIRSKTKKDINFNRNFDLFGDMETSSKKITEIFDKFGSMALINLKQNNLQFESDDITDKIYEIGFLIKHEISKIFKIKVHYEGLHLSVIEFAIAFSLWLNYKKNGNFSNDQLICIQNFIVEKGEYSLIVPFLCGLMGEKVNELFNQLYPCFGFYFGRDISFLLPECQQSELFNKAISPFISPVFELYGNEKLLKYGLEFQKIKFIHLESIEYILFLPIQLVEVTLVIPYCHRTLHLLGIDLLNPFNVHCKKIICIIDHFDLSDDELELILKFINIVDAKIKKNYT